MTLTDDPDDAASRLRALGYDGHAIDRLADLAEGSFRRPADVGRVLDRFPYEHDWMHDYQIRSAQASLLRPRIMCINAAILSYALLEAFPGVHRQLIALHRRGPDGVECGHVVTAHWRPGGPIGAFSKSNFAVLGHRAERFSSIEEVATSYARAYLSMGFTPLFFGLPRLEGMPGDWRRASEPLTAQLRCFTESYEYEFQVDTREETT